MIDVGDAETRHVFLAVVPEAERDAGHLKVRHGCLHALTEQPEVRIRGRAGSRIHRGRLSP